jgi:hypothetical protein
MTKRTAALTSMILLALGIAAFTGSALAGNGNGNGQADTQSVSADESASAVTPGNSADEHGNSANAPGQIKQVSVSTQASRGGRADQNAGAEAGAKPTSATAKGNKPTMCTTGGGTGSSATCTSSGATAATAQTAAKPDSSKRYGNSETAAQIASSHGAPAGTEVYGPGNSQPHKVLDCKRNHWVDVHAVKSYSTTPCSQGGTTGGTTGGTIVASSASGGTNSMSGTSTSVTSTPSSNAGTTAHGNSTVGGVLGATASGGKGAPAGGVLGAIESVGSGVLPFTGFPLWIVVLAAATLLASGLTLRRAGRATV